MEISIDGACRGNGSPGARGAAAAVFGYRSRNHNAFTRILSSWPEPTNQRAELTAMILALENAIEKSRRLAQYLNLVVNIHTDSMYVLNCMNVWIHTWQSNGWRNSRGGSVLNRDLIIQAHNLLERLEGRGEVNISWIPRGENGVADRYCNEALDDAY